MMRWLLLLFLASVASAQLRVAVVSASGAERRIQSFEDLGSIPMGDVLDIGFRLRNESAANIVLERLTIAGASYTFVNQPRLPQNVVDSLEFTVRFAPATAGSYGANLTINGDSYLLRATATRGLTLSLEGGLALASGSVIDFGSVMTGSRATIRFLIENRTSTALPASLLVTGAGFTLSSPGTLLLAPNESLHFDIAFSPSGAGVVTGALAVGDRSFVLKGTGLEPVLPPLRITVNPGTPSSGQQSSVSVALTAPSPVRLSGELTLSFTPETAEFPDDRAILFATGTRSVSFEIGQGQTAAVFSPEMAGRFQTGTTAGSLTLTARAGSRAEEMRLSISRAAATVTTQRASRSGNSLELQLTAFDNTRTASQLVFMFFDTAGAAIGQPLRIEVAEAFRGYFRTSSAGGAFTLRAVFPVTGDPTQIASAEVEIVNSAGTTRSGRLLF